MPALSKKAITVFKIIIISFFACLILYLIYGVAGCFWLLSQQPTFMTAEGISVSKGFWVQGMIYIGFLAIVSVVEGVLVYFLFFHKKVVAKIKAKKAAKG